MNINKQINRLLNIIVDEVSLVDRAANQHRFLIIKRDTDMPNSTPLDSQDTASPQSPSKLLETFDEESQPDDFSEESTKLNTRNSYSEELTHIPTQVLDTALATIEGLTNTLEWLQSLTSYISLDSISESLNDTDKLSESLGAIRSLILDNKNPSEKLSSEATITNNEETKKTTELPHELIETLTSMTNSFRTLTDTVKEQQQRLSRVEKQFGLPNSKSIEISPMIKPEEIGWPMDLNKPMNRENIDKSVSFHDI